MNFVRILIFFARISQFIFGVFFEILVQVFDVELYYYYINDLDSSLINFKLLLFISMRF